MPTRIDTRRNASLAPSIILILTLASACNNAHAAAPRADFNGDGRADLAIGVPDETVADQTRAGGVAVIYGRAIGLSQVGDQFWTAESHGINASASTNASFGGAVAAGDFDGDGFSDLAIGIPFQLVDGVSNAGAVEVIYGSSTGLTHVQDQLWTRDSDGVLSDPTVGAFFGLTLAAGDFNGDARDDLVIGVVNQTVGGQESAGEVQILYGAPSGLSAAGNEIFNQLTPGIEGEPEFEDAFGRALATGDYDGDGFSDLAIGIQGDTVDGVHAGAVEVLYGSASGLRVTGAQFIAQGLDALQNTPEESDNFGGALASGDFNHDGVHDLAISVPRENVAGVPFSGAIHVLYGTEAGLDTVNDQFWSQESPGVRDDAEQDDLFGMALRAGDFDGDEFDDLAISAPGETIEGFTSAGAVNVLYGGGSGLQAAGNQFWHRNSTGILGDPEQSGFFGVQLTAGDYDVDGFDDLAVAVGLGSANGVDQAGAVNVIYGTANGLRQIRNQLWHQDSTGILDSAEQGDRFGLVVR